MFRSNRKLSVFGLDYHTENNAAKAELHFTGAQIGARDTEWQRRIEILGATAAVPAAIFYITKLGFFLGSLLALVSAAMLCRAYAQPFLRFTGGEKRPIPLGDRLIIAIAKITNWILLTVNDLRDGRNEWPPSEPRFRN